MNACQTMEDVNRSVSTPRDLLVVHVNLDSVWLMIDTDAYVGL